MDMPLIAGLIVLALLFLGVLLIYNGIVGGHNRAQRAWADVLAYERQKARVLNDRQDQAAHFKDYEGRILESVTGLRSAIGGLPKEADGDALTAVEQGTKALMGGLKIAFEAYPDLKASEVVNNLMREIAEQQENVGAAIAIFNREVERFNNAIQMFPNSLVNSALNKKSPIASFTDREASAAFDYRPNF